MSQVLIEDLRKVPQLSDLSDEILQWIIDRSEVHTFEADEILTKTGDPVEYMWIIVRGSYDFYWDTNGQLTYIRSWKGGDVSGLLPYSRMKASPGYTISTSPGIGLMLNKVHFEEMEKRFPALVKRLIEIMTDRVREFTASHQQQEKMNALGRMSAGLAHELNNPAAAIQRMSTDLGTRLVMEIDQVLELVESRPDKKDILEVLLLLKEKAARSLFNTLSTLEKSQLEEELIEELGAFDKHKRLQIAESLADICVSREELKKIVSLLPGDSIRQVLPWVENVVISERLAMEIQKASTRISQLVNSIKSYAHMDSVYDMEPTDMHAGLDTTLVLLNHKMKSKKIQVVKKYMKDFPLVQAFPGELNQVWTNILDNAIDAMDMGGTLTVTTSIERNMVKVSIRDTGSGISPEIRNKIFDPFFTTKSVGKGIGLGLDMVKRIINKHRGEIKIDSVPGNTVFAICLPIPQKVTKSESSEIIATQ
jgi:signal transduction histidine kinase